MSDGPAELTGIEAAAALASPGAAAGGWSRLARDRSFWGLLVTQFLGAFNDNVYKQVVLLLSVGTVAVAAQDAASGPGAVAAASRGDRQSEAMALFALPFLLLSGLAGFLADRYRKRTIIVGCKLAEVGIMLAGLAALAGGSRWAALAVLCLMGCHSALFGPSKYGILPELLPARSLPAANGLILMTTFLAIILGTAVAGPLVEHFRDALWIAPALCVGLAVVGTATAVWVRESPPACPDLRFHWSIFGVPGDVRQMLWSDRSLIWALLASCMFWLVGGVTLSAVNALGMRVLQVGEQRTSLLAASLSIGIAAGCVLAGWRSRGRVDGRLVAGGAWGVVLSLALLGLPGSDRPQWLGYWGSLLTMVVLGASAGVFVVPIQAFLQSRPPEAHKGRMIGAMNLANWVAILLAAGLYGAANWLVEGLHGSAAQVFALTALVMLPVAVCYRPPAEASA